MASQAQIDANRENSKRSRGARTMSGRQNSRRNAYKHGLTGEGVTLADDLAGAVDERAKHWIKESGATTDDRIGLARKAALEEVRIRVCQVKEVELHQLQALRAESQWDQDQDALAAKVAEDLRRAPRLVARELERTAHGCDLKVREWETLLLFLRKGEPWDDVRRDHALDLMGVVAALRDMDVNAFGTTARSQAAFARKEIKRLNGLLENGLVAMDAHLQDMAVGGVALECRETWRIRRYEAGCRNRLAKHLAELMGRPGTTATATTPASSAKARPKTSTAPLDLTLQGDSRPRPVYKEEPADSLETWMGRIRASVAGMSTEQALAHLTRPHPGAESEDESVMLVARDAVLLEILTPSHVEAARRQRSEPLKT